MTAPGPAPTADGRLTADTGPITRVAAARLQRSPSIGSAGVRIIRDRGELVAQFDVNADSTADPAAVAADIDRVCAELLAVTQDRRLRARARLRVQPVVQIPGGGARDPQAG